ncbi:MAG TPA: hypothetical protein VND70_07430 [Acidimicrobiales bacterium]|nr:hypothetical protein [Acidimicrobiales bacterium]
MSYVDAGYVSALAGLFAYGIGLALRRRRWERALKSSPEAEGAGDPGARP